MSIGRTAWWRAPRRACLGLVRLVAITLALWFTWEMLQAPAFTGMPDAWWPATVVCAVAAAGDVAIVLGLWALGAVVFRDVRWFAPPSVGRYALVVTAAISVQIAVERAALAAGRWGYQPWHPVLPGLGVGILPIAQAVILVPVTFALLASSVAPRHRANPRRRSAV